MSQDKIKVFNDKQQEYNFKSKISPYTNLTTKEMRIHQSAFLSGYKLGLKHSVNQNSLSALVYQPKKKSVNKNKIEKENIMKEANKKADYIVNKVLRHYNRAYIEIISPRRLQAYAECRSMIVNLLRELTPLSLPEIGRMMGGRDHTTIIHHTRLKAERKRYWGVHHITWQHYEKLLKDLEIELRSI